MGIDLTRQLFARHAALLAAGEVVVLGYMCAVCPGGYFQYHREDFPACTEVVQPPHVIAPDGRGDA